MGSRLQPPAWHTQADWDLGDAPVGPLSGGQEQAPQAHGQAHPAVQDRLLTLQTIALQLPLGRAAALQPPVPRSRQRTCAGTAPEAGET